MRTLAILLALYAAAAAGHVIHVAPTVPPCVTETKTSGVAVVEEKPTANAENVPAVPVLPAVAPAVAPEVPDVSDSPPVQVAPLPAGPEVSTPVLVSQTPTTTKNADTTQVPVTVASGTVAAPVFIPNVNLPSSNPPLFPSTFYPWSPIESSCIPFQTLPGSLPISSPYRWFSFGSTVLCSPFLSPFLTSPQLGLPVRSPLTSLSTIGNLPGNFVSINSGMNTAQDTFLPPIYGFPPQYISLTDSNKVPVSKMTVAATIDSPVAIDAADETSIAEARPTSMAVGQAADRLGIGGISLPIGLLSHNSNAITSNGPSNGNAAHQDVTSVNNPVDSISVGGIPITLGLNNVLQQVAL